MHLTSQNFVLSFLHRIQVMYSTFDYKLCLRTDGLIHSVFYMVMFGYYLLIHQQKFISDRSLIGGLAFGGDVKKLYDLNLIVQLID